MKSLITCDVVISYAHLVQYGFSESPQPMINVDGISSFSGLILSITGEELTLISYGKKFILSIKHSSFFTIISNWELFALGIAIATAGANHPVSFDIRLLAVDGNEGCDIADIDGDGKLDVVAGRNWYRNGR